MSTTAPQTRPTVTALIVAHDGARFLPGLVQALAAQTYQVEQTVGVDTGSRDRSGAVLAELIGQDAVFGMDRAAGYGEAVAVALRHATRRRSGMTDPSLTRLEWIWLLHDDCEPAPDALEKLLRAASKDRSVVVVGPKVLDGQDRRTLREVGVSVDRAGRRVTGIDPGEIDQGQHDHKQAVLAVSSAGMLVRRDVWDRLGGFDPGLKFFRDDVDFCWRVQAAGLRVQVATDAILYHRELAARRRRPIEGGNARRLDRRNALFVLAVNLPFLPMLRVVGGAIIGSLIRATYFLLTKQLDLSAAYAFSVLGLFAHPVRLFRGRRRRAAGIAEGYYAVRLFIPPARTLFRLAEKIAGLVSTGPPQATYGRHQATAEESEEDEQFVDQQSVGRRIIKHPGVQLFAVLLIIALVAERRLLGTTLLGGGALVPAWGGAAALWQEYLAGFHAVSVGSTASAPPYLAVVAGLATLLGGQAWLAVDVLLLGCVPLAGVTAYLATHRLVTATAARMLLAASYALLPVATGTVAAGRLGTAAAFVLLPLMAVSAGRMLTAAPRQARRAAWATGLLIALAAAFAPLTWVLGLMLAAGALAARRWLIAVDPVNAAIVVVAPFFVLFPWSLHLLTSPSALLSEAGVSTPGLTTRGLSPTALLALSPGGPGGPPVWVTIGLGLALLALVLPVSRAEVVIAGWVVAIAGLLTAVVVSRISVTPPAGGQPASGWPGVAIALAALGLLLASAPAAQWLATIIPNGIGHLTTATSSPGSGSPGFGRSHRLLACVALIAAATAPLLVAAYWVNDGVRGPVGSISAPLVPAFVSASSTSGQQYRTLILRPDGAGLDYLVVRQGDPSLGEPELGAASAAGAALSRQVAALGAPDGADAGDPGLVLGSFGIRWVLLPAPVDPVLAQRLDAALGLVALNKGPSYDLWQVTGPVARVRVVAADGATTALPAGAVDMSAVTAPADGGTLVLAEPYGGWTATLNGQALKPVATPVDGWAQGFVLPPGGGRLSITRNDLARVLSLFVELLATLAICLLALPGKRTDPVQEAKALAALREARNGRRAASFPPRAARGTRTGGAGHRAASAADRLGLARKRRSGQAQPGLASENDEVPAGPAADQAPAAAKDAEFAKSARTGAVTGVGLADRGQDSYGDLTRDDDAGSSSAPWGMAGDWDSPSGSGAFDAWTADPLDTSRSRTDAGQRTDQSGQTGRLPGWHSGRPAPVPESPALGIPLPETGGLEARAPRETGPQRPPWESGTQAPVGSQPASRTGDHSASGTGERAIARTEAQSASPTGAQPVFWPREQPPAQPHEMPRRESRPDPQPASRTDPRSEPRTGAPAASGTGGQPVEVPPWESRPGPASRSGAQPVFRPAQQSSAPSGAQPVEGPSWQPGPGPQPVFRPAQSPSGRSGAQPDEVPPWESRSGPRTGLWGEQRSSTAEGAQPGDVAAWEPGTGARPVFRPAQSPSGRSGAQPGETAPWESEPESAHEAETEVTGSGSWPAPGQAAKPERHSHRAAKHGRPSRWRGPGNRSRGDGES